VKIHYNEIKHNVLDVRKNLRNECFNWGLDNLYPNTLEYLLNASVTAKNAVDKSAKAIIGKGVANGHVIVNSKGQTLNDVIRTSVREYIKHNNAFIWLSFNLLGEISAIESVPSKNVRVGKRDDVDYSGKYLVYSNWDGQNGRVDTNAIQIVDRFNLNPEIIKSQIENAGGIQKYKGQIIHLQKYFNEIYSLSDADCILNDMVSEIQASEFRQKGSNDGFLNTKLLVTKPFNSPEDRRTFLNNLDAVRGSKNSNSVILLESPDASSDLNEQINLQDLTSEHNDELFRYSESQVEKNIAKAFNVPISLINPSDSGIFGNSGELYKSIMQIMWQEREEERMKIEEIFTNIMNNYKHPISGRIDLISNQVNDQ